MASLLDLDTDKLSLLWEASGGNPVMKEAIESELQQRVMKNKNFTREYFFERTIMYNRSAAVEFIPASESFQTFGKQIQITLPPHTEQEMIPWLERIRDKNFTYGYVQCEPTYNDKLSEEQLQILKEKGFNTHDILSVA